jgi:ABC-type hemin transport system substrate-binding protein
MARALLLLILAALACCSDRATPAAANAAGAGPARRIASLSPAITATLLELGVGDRVVGRTPWCSGVDAAPVVGSMLEIDLERLGAVAPDLVLVQRTASGPPQGLVEAGAGRWSVEQVPCATLEDVRDLPRRVSEASRMPAPTAVDAWAPVLAPLAAANELSPAALLLSLDPVQAIGSDGYLAQAWRAWGCVTVPESRGYPQLGIEDLFALNPRSVIVLGSAQPDGPVARACAARGIAFVVIEDPGLLRPGPEARRALAACRARLEEIPR